MGEDWGKLIVAKGIKKLPKVQNIAQSGHTDDDRPKINKLCGVLPKLSGYVCAYHPAAPGLSPKHAIYAFINYSQSCAIFVM